ncbi:hypothetical protein R1sor_017022 [Riccia sorocarpa]|uniref:Uncharacterized protein n=1 Tax=Riccia sorocarpa TaxID=122646 RepID=A0ABD3I5M1_9MARC
MQDPETKVAEVGTAGTPLTSQHIETVVGKSQELNLHHVEDDPSGKAANTCGDGTELENSDQETGNNNEKTTGSEAEPAGKSSSRGENLLRDAHNIHAQLKLLAEGAIQQRAAEAEPTPPGAQTYEGGSEENQFGADTSEIPRVEVGTRYSGFPRAKTSGGDTSVSDSQGRSGVWRRAAGGRTGRDLAKQTKLEALEN